MAPGRRGGRIRLYIEGDATGAEVAAKKAEHAVDGLDSKTKAYTKSVDEQSRSTDRASRSHDRYSKSARESGRSNDNLSKSLRDVNTRITSLRNGVALLKWPALITGAGYAAEGLGEVAAAAVGLTSALAPLSGLLIAYPGYLGALAQGLGVGKLAFLGVTDAVKEMSTVQETAGTTATESAKAHEAAAEGVRSAEENLTQANRTAKDARTELNAAEAEAVDNLRTLKDAAVDASLSEERAAQNLHVAKAALRKAQNEPGKHNFNELADLELSVREARQGLKEAREEKASAERERAKGERQGVKGNPKVVEAHRSLQEAKHQVGLSSHQLAKAQDAERESLEQTGTAATRLQQKLATLPPAAQKFAKYIFGLKPKLQSLQSTAAEGLFPGIEKGIHSAMALFPRLNTAVGGTAKVMGNLATKAGEFVGSKGFGRDFSTIAKGNETLISRLGLSSIKWADALRQVLVAGQPLLKWISKSGLEFSTWVDNAAKAGRESGSLAGFFDKTRHVAEQLFTIIGNLAGGFFNVGRAAAPLGEEILDSFERSSESFENWTNSMEGKNELKAYFEEAKPGIFELGRLVRDASKDLIELSKGQGFLTMTRAVRTELLPVLTEMVGKTTEAFGPALVGALVQVGKLLGNLSGASGPLTLFTEQVTSMLQAINWGFKNIPGLKFFVITLGTIATVAKALKFTGMVSGLSSSLGLVKKIAQWLGVIETKQEGQALANVVAGAPVIGGLPGAGRDLRTAAGESAGEFGEKQALRDAGLLTAGGTAAKGGSIAARLGLVGEEGVVTGLGLGVSAVAAPVGIAAYMLAHPTKLSENPAHEKDLHDRGLQLAALEKQFHSTMVKLRSDAAVGMGAINAALATGLNLTTERFKQGTGPWRQRTAEAMKAAVAEIRQGMKAGTISTEEGRKAINADLARIHLVRGDDPFGLAEATTKQFKSLNEISASGISSWTRKLQQMPVAAREKSRQATEGMLEEWAAGHPKLEAQIGNLTDFEITKFGATNKQIREGVKRGATGPVAEAFKEAAEGVGGALENIKVNANQMLKALGWSSLIKFQTHGFGAEAKLTGETAKRSHNLEGRAQGGWGGRFLGGTGLRDTEMVMAAPGEAFLTRHQQPEVQAGLALAKALGIGQNGSLDELFANRRTPHYMAKGGEVIGPRATATIAGAALNKVDKAVEHFLSKHPSKRGGVGGGTGPVPSGHGIDYMDGKPVAEWIWKILESARKAGVSFTISSGLRTDAEQLAIYESGVRPAAVPKALGGPGSNHEGIVYPAGAVDISPGAEALNEWLVHSRWRNTLIYAGAKDPVHFSHPHDGGYARGGIVRGKVSWFSGGATAGGRDTSEPGMALNLNPGTESGWENPTTIGWREASLAGHPVFGAVTIAGHSANLPITDMGPAGFTGRAIDITEGGVRKLGFSTSDFPTDAIGVVRILGSAGGATSSKPRAASHGRTTPLKPGIAPGVSTGERTTIGPASVAAVAPLTAGVVSGAATGLPQQFQSLLKMPGLNFGQKLTIANEALSYGEETGTSVSAAASFGAELEERNKTRLQERLKKLNAELKHSTTPKKREALLKQRAGVLSSLGTVRSELANFRGALKTGEEDEAPEPPSRMAFANAELAEAELTPGRADDRAIQEKELSIAEEELATAKANNDPEAISAAAAAVKQLTETLKQNNVLAESQLHTSAELALAELTPDKGDDEAARKKLLRIAEERLAQAEAEGNDEGIIQFAGELKGLKDVIEASNESLQQREGFEKEQLDVNKRLAKIAEEQGPAFMGAFVAYLDGAIGGPLQTNSRLATAGVAAAY